MTESQEDTVIAHRALRPIAIDAANSAGEWHAAEPVCFHTDWQGKNPDPALETEVRVLWSPEMLYLRFVCRCREIFVFGDSDAGGRRGHLWERDVVEVFLQPPESMAKMARAASCSASEPKSRYRAFYKEFEVAPNGMWLDLDISPAGPANLHSGLVRSACLYEKEKIWMTELSIPMKSLTARFDPALPWRANFYRVEGKAEPRHYLAWQPTRTPEPDFHVPEAFGTLRFVE